MSCHNFCPQLLVAQLPLGDWSSDCSPISWGGGILSCIGNGALHTLNYYLCGEGATVTFVQNPIIGYDSSTVSSQNLGYIFTESTPGYLQCSSLDSSLPGESMRMYGSSITYAVWNFERQGTHAAAFEAPIVSCDLVQTLFEPRHFLITSYR